MAVHPKIQQRAQAEIDEKIGLDQVPHPAQSTELDYLTAILKEVLRYAPVGNMGESSRSFVMDRPLDIFLLWPALPHRVTEDDEFAGYRIPKDATVIANVWYAPSLSPLTYGNKFKPL